MLSGIVFFGVAYDAFINYLAVIIKTWGSSLTISIPEEVGESDECVGAGGILFAVGVSGAAIDSKRSVKEAYANLAARGKTVGRPKALSNEYPKIERAAQAVVGDDLFVYMTGSMSVIGSSNPATTAK